MPLVLAFESVLCFLLISCCGFVFPFSLFSLNPALFCKEQFPQGGESSGQPDFHVFCGRLGREHNAPWKPRVQDVHVENCQFFFFNTRCILIWNKFIFSSLTSYYMHWVFFIKDKHSFLWLLCLCNFFWFTEMLINCTMMNSVRYVDWKRNIVRAIFLKK